jgi:hypothetical protein
MPNHAGVGTGTLQHRPRRGGEDGSNQIAPVQRQTPSRPHGRDPLPHRPAHDEEELLQHRGLSLGQRLLGLLAAFSFLALGIGSLVPMLQPQAPPAMPDRQQSPAA